MKKILRGSKQGWQNNERSMCRNIGPKHGLEGDA